MNKIVFATNNKHKLEEIRAILSKDIQILSLDDIKCYDEIEETENSFEGNALIKARFIKEKYGYYCFADDSGLMVDALNGRPGVYSARYAGQNGDADANIDKLLNEMQGKTNRNAKFVTVIALIDENGEHIFKGEIYGNISEKRMGENGFGYDPIFIPENSKESFAEMGADKKNQISHRARALAKLKEYLI